MNKLMRRSQVLRSKYSYTFVERKKFMTSFHFPSCHISFFFVAFTTSSSCLFGERFHVAPNPKESGGDRGRESFWILWKFTIQFEDKSRCEVIWVINLSALIQLEVTGSDSWFHFESRVPRWRKSDDINTNRIYFKRTRVEAILKQPSLCSLVLSARPRWGKGCRKKIKSSPQNDNRQKQMKQKSSAGIAFALKLLTP